MAINKIVLLILWCELQIVWPQKTIPKSLRECYRNNVTLNFQLPLSLRVLVDIVQKLERHSYATADMRTLSSSILHRFKFDGIEYQEDVQASDSVLPFSGTGNQRIKHALIEELIPGREDGLPVHILSHMERCTLHQAISNSILIPKYENKYKPCRQVTLDEKLSDKTLLIDEWDCPRQQGVILTPYGTVAPGVIIEAIAAALQHQNVAMNQLVANLEIPLSEMNQTGTYNIKYDEEEIDFVLPRSQMIHTPSMWYNTLISSTVKLDNIWLATIAGELAEMVIFQGPVLGSNMTLGATGFWQNAINPTIFYLTNSDGNFDATRAELIGGIDGMIIANYMKTWTQNFYSLRLSQILKMYYSNEGITLNNMNVKACDRARMFLNAVPKTILNEQTYAIAQMLAYRKSIAYVSPEKLQRMVDVATEKFYAYAENHLFPELPCHEKSNAPRVEALIVLDGAWTIEYTINFLAVLIQDLDISMYGSRMGIIHGTSGEWLLNVTNSPAMAFQTINNFTNILWPTKLNFTKVLKTVSIYFNETWEYNRKRCTIGNLGQVVILLTPLGYISSNDGESVLKLLQRTKHTHPDVHFIYYTSRYNGNVFEKFILSDEDHLIKNSNINDITQCVSKIPLTLRPAKSLDPNSTKIPQFEDYISPSKSTTYKIHSHWKRNMKKILITLHTFGYGTMNVCLWAAFEPSERKYLHCADLAGYKEITLTDHFKCTDTSPCPSVYLRIQNVTSLYKCAEIDCETPDQVRYIVRTNHQDIHYGNSGHNAILVLQSIIVSFILHMCL